MVTVRRGRAAAVLALAVAAAGLPGCGEKAPACPVPTQGLPTLVDLGSAKVKPSREMAPVFEGLKKDFAGALTVASIDVDAQADVEKRFNLQRVPAQVFYSAAGKELARHEGPWTREEILAKWKELGVALAASAPAAPAK
jgi:thioredoxin 1